MEDHKKYLLKHTNITNNLVNIITEYSMEEKK